MPFKHWQAWGITTSLGSLFQGLTTLWVMKYFLMSSLNLPWCCFEPFPQNLSLDPREKRSAPLSPLALLRKLLRVMRSPFSRLYSELEKSRVLCCFSQEVSSRLFTSFVALLWMHVSTFTCFFNCGAQNCTQYSRWDHVNVKYSRIINAFWLAGYTVFDAPQGAVWPLGCQGTLLICTEPTQHHQILFCRSTLQPLLSQFILAPALLCPMCRIWHLFLLNFIPSIIVQCSSLSRSLCKASCPSKVLAALSWVWSGQG